MWQAALAVWAGTAGPGEAVTVGQVEDSLGISFVRVEAGSFVMGAARDERGRLANEMPAREVEITRDFLMGVHEVTVGQFRAFVEATGYETEAERDVAGGFGIDFRTGRVVQDSSYVWTAPGFPGLEVRDDHPVVLISWNDAEAFCAWMSEREGVRYRLPTEAEWEYACRGGTRTAWWSGDTSSSLATRANVADEALLASTGWGIEAGAFDDGFAFVAPVGSFEANPLGLHDMHGNVWEWCSDWYGADAYATESSVDPTGPASGEFRTIRGGGWLNPPVRARSAQRIYFSPTFRYCLLSGFRVVREVEAEAGDQVAGRS